MAREPNPVLATPFQGWIHPDLAAVHDGLTSLTTFMELERLAIPDEAKLKPHEIGALEWFESLPTYANGLALSGAHHPP